jgi:hypothetical protein
MTNADLSAWTIRTELIKTIPDRQPGQRSWEYEAISGDTAEAVRGKSTEEKKQVLLNQLNHKDERAQRNAITTLMHGHGMAEYDNPYRSFLAAQKQAEIDNRGLSEEAGAPRAVANEQTKMSAAIWEEACRRATGDAQRERAVLTPLLHMLVALVLEQRNKNTDPVTNTTVNLLNGDSINRDGGPGIQEAIERIVSFADDEPHLEDLVRIAKSGKTPTGPQSALFALIVEHAKALATPEGVWALKDMLDNNLEFAIKNRHLSAESMTILAAFALEQMEMTDPPGKESIRFFRTFARRGGKLNEEQIRQLRVKVALARVMVDNYAFIQEATTNKEVRDMLANQGSAEQNLNALPVCQGRFWVERMKTALTATTGELDLACELERCDEWNMNGVNREDLLSLISHPNQRLRDEGVRLAGIVREVEQAKNPKANRAHQPDNNRTVRR